MRLSKHYCVSEVQDGALGAGQRDDACGAHEHTGATTPSTQKTQPAAQAVGAAGTGVGAVTTKTQGSASTTASYRLQ